MESPDLTATIDYDPEEGLVDLARHIDRLKDGAAAAPFALDAHAVANELQAACFRWRTAARVRIAVSPGGAIAIEVAARS